LSIFSGVNVAFFESLSTTNSQSFQSKSIEDREFETFFRYSSFIRSGCDREFCFLLALLMRVSIFSLILRDNILTQLRAFSYDSDVSG